MQRWQTVGLTDGESTDDYGAAVIILRLYVSNAAFSTWFTDLILRFHGLAFFLTFEPLFIIPSYSDSYFSYFIMWIFIHILTCMHLALEMSVILYRCSTLHCAFQCHWCLTNFVNVKSSVKIFKIFVSVVSILVYRKKYNFLLFSENFQSLRINIFLIWNFFLEYSQITAKRPLVNNYNSTLRLIFRLMMSKYAFVTKHYFILILSDEKYHTAWALCLEQLSWKTLISSYLQATLCFFIFVTWGTNYKKLILRSHEFA